MSHIVGHVVKLVTNDVGSLFSFIPSAANLRKGFIWCIMQICVATVIRQSNQEIKFNQNIKLKESKISVSNRYNRSYARVIKIQFTSSVCPPEYTSITSLVGKNDSVFYPIIMRSYRMNIRTIFKQQIFETLLARFWCIWVLELA